jgi:hypothetical protein
MENHATVKPIVFISYARGEDPYSSSFAEYFCRELEKNGLQTQLDVKDIMLADPWQDVVQTTLYDPQSICLTLLSPQYVFSKSTIYEKDLAEGIFSALGKPIIPVLLKEFRDYEKFISAHVYADFRDLFARFCANKGANLSKEWRMKFEESTKQIVRSVESQFDKYYNNLNLSRIENPQNPYFEKSKSVYDLYPERFTDPHEKIYRWLNETFMGDPADYHNEEIYIIASYQGRVVGILYATMYKRILRYPSYCHINLMVVEPEYQNIEIVHKDGENEIRVTAEALLSSLKTIVEKYDRACEKYVFEKGDRHLFQPD